MQTIQLPASLDEEKFRFACERLAKSRLEQKSRLIELKKAICAPNSSILPMAQDGATERGACRVVHLRKGLGFGEGKGTNSFKKDMQVETKKLFIWLLARSQDYNSVQT